MGLDYSIDVGIYLFQSFYTFAALRRGPDYHNGTCSTEGED
jgi:hypothetical protein